jgi:chemosensory pili system protein ChpA (sensor histidine kinase/response regulator)
MSTTQDYVALEWIRGELANTLQGAQVALEAVAESPDDASSMRSCLSAIHQVHGTLKMVQLEGPTQMASEMEQVAQSLMNNSVPELRPAQETLMQAILQLPAYLDRLHREQSDSEKNYLPIVNNLRVARGEQKIPGTQQDSSESSGPDLSPLQAPPKDVVVNSYFQADGEGNLPKIRARYQQALGAIFKKTDVRGNLTILGKLFTMLRRLCGESPMGNLADLGLGIVEGIANGGIKLDNTTAGLLKAIDDALKQLADAGQDGLASPIDETLVTGLIKLVQGAQKDTKRLSELKARYASQAAEPEEITLGPDDETMSAVAKILIEELRALTDKLDLYVRSPNPNTDDLVVLLPNLRQISSTMVVLGDTTQQAIVAEQIEVINNLEAGALPSEETLLNMAQALLQIEAVLGALVTDGGDGESDAFANLDAAQAAVVRETRIGLAAGKDAVIDFISSEFDQTKLTDLPDSLRALRGGLTIVSQTRAGDVLLSAANYVAIELLAKGTTPELERMDDLADAITSIDYYLERLLENAGDPYVQMLEVAETAVSKLGYAVGVEVEEPSAEVIEEPSAEVIEEPSAEVIEEPSAGVIEEPSAEVIEEPSAELIEEPSAELIEEPSAEVIEEPSAEVIEEPSVEVIEEPSAELIEEPSVEPIEQPPEEVREPSPSESDDLIDDEILEIFVEEAEEVLENINEFFPQWRADLNDEDALAEIRRAFHTLKGSGRMVGATVVAELAWSIEDLLNRVLENSVVAGDAVMAIIGDVVASIPEGVAAFKEGEQYRFKPDNLAAIANALANGQEPPVIEEPSAEVIEEPSAEVIEEPSAEVIEELSAEVMEEPSAEVMEEPSAEVMEEPSAELIEEPSAEFIEELTLESVELVEETEALELESFDEEPIEEELDTSFELHTDDGLESKDESFELEDPTVDEVELVLEEIELETTVADDLELDPVGEDEIEESFELDTVDEAFEETADGSLLETADGSLLETADGSLLETADGSLLEAADGSLPEAADGSLPEAADGSLLEAADGSFELDPVDEIDEFEIDVLEDVVEIEAAEIESDELELDDIELFEIETDDIEADEIVEDIVVASPAAFEKTLSEELLDNDDLELEEIFTIEAEEKLDIIDHFVANPIEVSGDLVAAFHTLKGSSAMAEIESIAKLSAPMEQLANEYLQQNKPADSHLIEMSELAVQLIRTVLSDIDANRTEVEGGQALIVRISGGQVDSAIEEPVFDFEQIKLLSEANIAADGWQDIEALCAELKHADEQAQRLGQPELSALLDSMLRIYTEANTRPDDLTLSLMKRAHDHLVFMFDALASSQSIRPATGVIEELNAIEMVIEDAVSNELETVEVTADIPEEAQPQAEPIAAVVELPQDNIDEDILPIFLEEAEEIMEELDLSILGWSESGEPGDYLDGLLRQLHTLKGGARMAGISSLGEYAHNFETFLIGLQSKPVEFDDTFFALLNAQQDEITRRVEIYQKVASGGADDAELASLRTAAAPSLDFAPAVSPSLADEQPPEESTTEQPTPAVSAGADTVVELPADQVDEDVLPIFLEESDDLVEELETSIQSWSESPGDMDTLDVLLRNLHTLKGGARMAGLNSLGEYAHNFETFLIGIQQNPIELDDDFFGLLNKRQDEVIRRVEIYKKLSFGAASEDDLESLKSALEPTLETEPVHSPDVADVAGPQKQVDEPTQQSDKGAASSNQEMVRVSADLLEELVGLAGESSITRGRIEQQITDFGESLQEMEETITRIRDQVRRLEIEAESRETLIRSRQAAEAESSFDELEMDRYTMLQAISRALNEGTSDMMDLKDTLGNRSRDAETLLHQQARISGELQEGLTRTRMVPFARLIPRLRRIVRQISTEVGKSVRFDAYNVEGELDRNVLERIVAPLEHMLRNAVDHGIEDKDDRAAAGKQEQGRISLRLSREGGYVVLNVSDDGGGIDVKAVRGKAIERGLISEGQEVSDHEVMQFIMHAGFSTAQKLTQISGRGVGMDVVGSEIKSLGGSITIDSTLGIGTEFTIRIPFTVSINRALMVVVREETYAVPLNSIEGIVRVSPYELEAYYQPDAPMFEYAGQPYRLAYMGKMLDKADDPDLSGQVAPLPVILARSGDHAVALQVDQVIGSREVVVKTLGKQFGDVGGISGATVLGDGSVVIILDCMALVRGYEAGADSAPDAAVEVEAAESVPSVRTIMIVDDSVTVRKVTSRLMERQGFEVITAKDGIDAMNQLQDVRPDVMLLDIEMPRMDGFEVLRSVRRDESIKDLPIIMITSRTGEKHKQQAMELGVNQYLGKPFQEASLLATIEEVISSAKAKSKQE